MKSRIEEYRRAVAQTGSNYAAAKLLGVNESTIRRAMQRHGLSQSAPGVEMPDFPDDDIPVEEIIALQAKRYIQRKQSHDAHTWFPVKVTDKKPVGILWFGDPHLDDNGADWPTLTKHIDLCKTTDGLYGANIGDTTNNWAGRLVRLYANQDTSVKTARRLAEWFMVDSGVTWLVWLIGNHDAWGDGADILARMAKTHGTQKLVCHDWEARFRLTFPGGWEPKIYAAHDFPGHSQWNPLHGPMKAGQMGQEADLYVCGHKHNAAYFTFPNAARGGREQHFLRLRGYKGMDDHTRRLGIVEQDCEGGALTIFVPEKQKILVFPDVEEGADYLKWLRR